MPEFDKFKIHKIKEVAKLIKKDIAKRQKLEGKITELQKQYDGISMEIDQWNTPIKEMTGGYGVEDLVVEIKEEGKPSRFDLRYPDTVIPPQELAKGVNPADVDSMPIEELESMAVEAAFNPLENVH